MKCIALADEKIVGEEMRSHPPDKRDKMKRHRSIWRCYGSRHGYRTPLPEQRRQAHGREQSPLPVDYDD